MTSVLQAGKYRQRKERSTNSIPELLISTEEDEVDFQKGQQQLSPAQIQVNQVLHGNVRRTSLGFGLLGGAADMPKGMSEKHYKRRSSIAVPFLLGRRDNAHKNKDFNDIPIKKSNQLSVYPINYDDGSGQRPHMDAAAAGGAAFDPNRKRRSSWQAKMERRRRKSLATGGRIDEHSTIEDYDSRYSDNVELSGGSGLMVPGDYGQRQKRNSWWNIFVPDNFKQRSRRSSQDVGMLTRNTDRVIPFRSKSRSVDHGLAPYGLDSLKSKVDGRIDSVERLREAERKKIQTTTYTVNDRDTLTSVAARFGTTPSELTSINRLISSFIYPGQQLLVPDKQRSGEGSDQSGRSSPTSGSRGKGSCDDLQEEKELLDGLRPTSPKPGHIERVPVNVKEEDPIITQRFLKINVRHITDGQGVVGGVLLVTPNAVMFDPNVSDPLVIDRGPESYGVIAPMELVVNAAIFNDIAHMRVGNEQSNEKPDVYYPKSPSPLPQNISEGTHSPGNDSLLVKDEIFPELGAVLVEAGDDQESICSNTEREGCAFPKAFDRDLVTPTNLTGTEQSHGNDDDVAGAVEIQKLEERRKSLLDHHWAIPSKDSQNSQDDVEEEEDIVSKETSKDVAKTESEDPLTNNKVLPPKLIQPVVVGGNEIDNETLEKLSCYDSGIDIRDPAVLQQILPHLQQQQQQTQVQPKKYSDADIVLSNDWVPPFPLATHLSTTVQGGVQLLNAELGTRKKNSSVGFSVDEIEQTHSSNLAPNDKTVADKKNKMLKRLSYPLAWVEGLTGEANKSTDSTESAPNTGDSNQSVFSKVFSRRSSIGTFIRPHSSDGNNSNSSSSSGKPHKIAAPKLDYRSMVSIDDMPELFVSFDKLIPRPARACQDPPLYLRLRMGRPLGKGTPLPSSVMSYGKNKLRPEYWFSIPKNRVDELFRFLNSWVPQLYGELNPEKITEMGYELIEHDTEWAQSGIQKLNRSSIDGDDIAELTRESWEASKNVLSISGGEYDKHILFPGDSIDVEFTLPDLVGNTEILTEEHREKLCAHLPARAEGYSWSLVFSTSLHGFSLNSLYRKMYRLESPILIVIQDTDNNVFGALTSCSLHVSDHFYGTGESLLYKFNPSFKVFHWTGENLYFIKGNPESLSIGAGDGKFGLWLDGDLNQGRTQPCSTYGNESLAPVEDFVVKTIECWAFI